MKIETFVFNPFQENTYVVADETTGMCAIVDPGMCNVAEMQRLDRYITSNGLTVQHILLTHFHVDHVLGSAQCCRKYGVGLSGSVSEQRHMPDAAWQASAFGIEMNEAPAPITHNLSEGDRFMIGSLEVEVIDCPGHSFAGLCFYIASEGVLMSGDVLFCGSVGRSDFGAFMGCNGPQLADNISRKLLTLPPSTLVYPGHGSTTTIGYEAEWNPYVQLTVNS